ncbi:MAG: hypothetical protein ACE5I7_11605 [Candidatus Binatia bacterium]
MENPRRWKRAGVGGWKSACCAVAVSLVYAASASAVVSVTVATSDGVPGGTVTLTMSVSRTAGEPPIANVQADILFDTTQIQLVGTCVADGAACQGSADCAGDGTCDLPCEKDPRLAVQILSATLPVTVRPPDPAPMRRLRLAVLPPTQVPIPTFDDGVVATCTFQVPDTAELGPQTLTSDDARLNAGDALGQLLPAEAVLEPGSVVAPPTPTPTGPTGTPTPVVTETETPAATPATETPTDTPVVTVSPSNTPTNTPMNTPTVKEGTATPANTPTNTLVPTRTATSVPPTATRTNAPQATATKKGGGGGGCTVTAVETGRGGAFVWFVVPAALLLWRRRFRG